MDVKLIFMSPVELNITFQYFFQKRQNRDNNVNDNVCQMNKHCFVHPRTKM